MIIIRDIKRVEGKLPSLEGHAKQCTYGNNADGSDALICVCPPTVTIEKEAKIVEAPVVVAVKKTESKIETLTIDTDADGVADVTITGDVVRGTNGKAVAMDIDGDGVKDTVIKGTIVSRRNK